jgi:hypothetical protein
MTAVSRSGLMRLTYTEENHAYWLDFGDGRGKQRCKGLSRTAKVPDDMYAIEMWNDRMLAVGMALRSDLVERAAAHYDDREKLETIAREAKDAAKAFMAQHRGTAAHAIVEKADRGQLIIATEFSEATVKSWNRALDDYGLEPVVGMSERIVVYPELLICGRWDTLRRYRRDGKLKVIDLKTGEKANRYPHAHSIQLGCYANAPLLAGPLSDGIEGWTEDFEPLPEDLDREIGYVVHMPEPTKAQVLPINIAAGFEMFQRHIVSDDGIYAWRKRDDLWLTPEIPERELEVLLLRSLPRFEWARERRAWIKEQGYGQALAEAWSDFVFEIPTFPKGGPRTEEELSRVIAVLDLVEMQCEVPFGPSDPDPPDLPTPADRSKQAQSQESRERTRAHA